MEMVWCVTGMPPVAAPLPAPTPPAPPQRLFGMKPSDIDKYSRIVFPITFLSFHLMYWTIYLTISDVVVEDLVHLDKE
jgi:glycine receptor alpha-3